LFIAITSRTLQLNGLKWLKKSLVDVKAAPDEIMAKLLILSAALIIVLLMVVPHVFADSTPIMPYNPNSRVVIDGKIGVGEYENHFTDQYTGIKVDWEHDNTYMYIGLTSPGVGWVAIGFTDTLAVGHEGPKGGAHMILAAVQNDGALNIYDLIGTGFVHENASVFGVVEAAGTRENNEVVVEFKYPLKFSENDHYEISGLEPGKVYLYELAYNDRSTDISAIHSGVSWGEFYVGENLPGENIPKVSPPPGLPSNNLRTLFILIHTVGLAFGLGGVTINVVLTIKARFDKELASTIIKILKTIGPLIFLGLLLLTISGIGFMRLGYPLTRTLAVKHILVVALWVESPLIFYLTSKLAKLAPKQGEPPSHKFLSTKMKMQALVAVGVFLWYTTTALGTLLPP